MTGGIVLIRADRERDAAGHPRHLHPALDLKTVAAGLQAQGIPVTLFDAWTDGGTPDAWCRQALAVRPRAVVVKAETWCLPQAIDCAMALRVAGVPTLAIGQQVAHALRTKPPGWRQAYDLAIGGEPEVALLELLPRIVRDRGLLPEIGRVGIGETRVMDPDGLPQPRFSAREMEAFAFPFPLPGSPLRRWAYVLTARGCPHRCRHCSSVVRKSVGGDLRRRDASRVVDEVARHLDDGAQAIAFEDDTLFVDRRHMLGICDELQRRSIRVPWIANARPDELDEERVAAAAASGARLLKIGIESASPRLIEAMGKSRRGSDWLQYSEEGMARLRHHGIASVGLFLIGLPTESEAEIVASWTWAKRLSPDYVQVQIFRSYPDAPWWHEIPEALRDGAAAYHYGPVSISAADVPPQRLEQLQREFYRHFYLRAGYAAAHARKYWRHYLGARGIAAGMSRLRFLGADRGREALIGGRA